MNQEPKKHLSPWIAWSIILLVAGSAGFAVWFYWNDVDTICDNISITTIKKTDNADKVASETADWKTYTNNSYGFSFKYPKDWIIGDQKFDIATLDSNNIYKKTGTVEEILLNRADTQGALFSLWIMGKDIDNAILADKSIFGQKTQIDFIVDGIKGYKLTNAYFGSGYIVKNSNTYFFHQINSKDDSDNATYTEILSTFQFTK